jgi:hypothetical protein
MMLPDGDRVRVDRAKIIDYLLGASSPVTAVVESPHGTRYTVAGPLRAPDGRMPMVRTVWIVEPGSPPRLITAHPL